MSYLNILLDLRILMPAGKLARQALNHTYNAIISQPQVRIYKSLKHLAIALRILSVSVSPILPSAVQINNGSCVLESSI